MRVIKGLDDGQAFLQARNPVPPVQRRTRRLNGCKPVLAWGASEAGEGGLETRRMGFSAYPQFE